MSPYLSFGLAMCAIVLVSLFFTAYLAVHFNRRAKRDMLTALTPLAVVLEGETDVEEARAHGRFAGHLAEGRAASADDGPGRVFHTTVIDGAGGEAWQATLRRPKDPAEPTVTGWTGRDDEIGRQLRAAAEADLAGLVTGPGWARLGYDPGPGHVRLTRPMATRRDLPDAATFKRTLDLLVSVADRNRGMQNPGS